MSHWPWWDCIKRNRHTNKGSFHARLRRTCSLDENIIKFSGTPFLSIAPDVQPFWSELWVSLHLVRTEPIDSYPSHLSPFLSPRYVDYVILRIEWWERRTNTFLSRAVDTGLSEVKNETWVHYKPNFILPCMIFFTIFSVIVFFPGNRLIPATILRLAINIMLFGKSI